MIDITDIAKSFGSNAVLQGVTLSVGKGESMVVIGGSGTGKSVLLKIMIGLITPDAGEIALHGTPLTQHNRADFLHKFGMLFQGAALFDSLPIWQNIAFRFLSGPQKMTRADAQELAVEKLARVGLKPDVAFRLPAELSGGMQKRVGLARAIATDPEIIFFDEPTTGLDPIMAGVINDLIRSVVSDLGATTITITHDMQSVRAIADKVAMLYDGQIKWQGGVDDLDATDNAFVRQFVDGAADGPIALIR